SICTITLIIGAGLTAVILNAQTSQNQSASSSATQELASTTVTQGAPATTVTQSGISQEGYATPICIGNTGSTKITLIAEQVKVKIATNVTYDGWSFNGTIPGPTIWVNLCE